jgi:dTDP-L-rhamnose 4-epimerase
VNGRADRILVTGGAGFIGSHLANALVERGFPVRVLDTLESQVHGPDAEFPERLHDEVERVSGDIRDPAVVRAALRGVSAVYHFASAVGVGQSMYQIAHYTGVNNLGTATLLEALIEHPVERLVVASSMSVYGEGRYIGADGQVRAPPPRSEDQLRQNQWELSEDGEPLEPVATDEDKPPMPTSVYALSKYDQERLCLICGGAYRIPTVALRFFNVYGPHQSLSNPYTGVLAIFASRCLNGNPPLIFEDGLQRRDFVHVDDIVGACLAALTTRHVGQVFNVGSGVSRTVLDVAHAVIRALDVDVEPVITGKYRAGDIRHCFADITRARVSLGYQPRVDFDAGIAALTEWLERASASDDYLRAAAELESRGLAS